jgi:hypothetical protein
VGTVQPLVIMSEFLQADITPDANLEKEMWSRAQRIRFDEDAFSRTSYPALETQVASRWTSKYLYLGLWCNYEFLNTYQGEDPALERWELWERDVVEAFIGPRPENPSHYFEFEVAPNNQWLDLEIDLNREPFNNASWSSGFEHATRVNAVAGIWTAEMRIPFAAFNAQIRPQEWKINFYRCEGLPPGSPRRYLSWGPLVASGPGASFHQPASFGVLRFAQAATVSI